MKTKKKTEYGSMKPPLKVREDFKQAHADYIARHKKVISFNKFMLIASAAVLKMEL